LTKQRRVYELAREFKVSSQAMLDVLVSLEFEVKSHMSPVNEEMLERVVDYFEGQKAEAKAEDSRKKEVAQKRKAIEQAQKDADRAERDETAARRKAEKEKKEAEESRVRRKLEEEAAKRVAEKLSRVKSETERLKQQATEAKRRAEEQLAAMRKKGEPEKPPVEEEEAAKTVSAEEPEAEVVEPVAEPTEAAAMEEIEEAADEKPAEEDTGRLDKTGRLSGASLRERIKQSKDAREVEGTGPRIIERRAPQPKERRPAPKPVPETRGKKKRKKGRKQVDQEEVRSTIRETLADLRSGPGKGGKGRRRRRGEVVDEGLDQTMEETPVIQVTEFASVAELAQLMDVKPSEIIAACFGLGLMVTINQRLDMETIQFITDEFGYEVKKIEEYGADIFEEEVEEVEENLESRPPVVTIMGHVDHGKTSLLDYIRRTRVVAGEVGGITQHIGAYEVQTKNGGMVTFLDTPGHEAFTAMRARGAQLTDLVVLVVAADDKVMPQTVEAINHAKAAGVPLVVAINKVDLPDADPDGVRQQLSGRGVVVEEYGGDTVCVEVSAKSGQGVDRLLEMILLQADLLELKADPTGMVRGVVVEAELDKGRGAIATVLVQKGTLREGDPFLCGLQSGRVRALLDERGNRIEEALPSQPAQVLGFSGVPQPGDNFHGFEDEKEARDLSLKRQQIRREQEFAVREAVSLSDLRSRIESGDLQELPLIVKADTDGSVEAVSDSFQKLSTDEVQVRVIHKGVGGITETDVMLAQASGAIIIGFHVRPDRYSREAANQAGVEIRLYEIIYEAVEDIRKGLEGLLRPEVREEILGTVEVRDTFRIPKAGTIAGCMVTEGSIHRGQHVRLIRDGVTVHDGRIGSLKRFKEDVKEVREGFECGVGIDNFNDVKVGDVIEVYERKEIARTL